MPTPPPRSPSHHPRSRSPRPSHAPPPHRRARAAAGTARRCRAGSTDDGLAPTGSTRGDSVPRAALRVSARADLVSREPRGSCLRRHAPRDGQRPTSRLAAVSSAHDGRAWTLPPDAVRPPSAPIDQIPLARAGLDNGSHRTPHQTSCSSSASSSRMISGGVGDSNVSPLASHAARSINSRGRPPSRTRRTPAGA